MKEADENEESSMEISSQFTGFNEVNADEKKQLGNDISMNFHIAVPSTILSKAVRQELKVIH